MKYSNIDLQKLMDLISEQGLDVSQLNYGGFIRQVNAMSWHPDKRAEIDESMFQISVGSICYQAVENEHDIRVTKAQAKRFERFIALEMESERYKKSFKDHFNAYSYEYTVYYDKARFGWGGDNWWLTHKMEERLPLDAEADRDQRLLKETEEQAKASFERRKKISGAVGYKVEKVYYEMHYRDQSEFMELAELGRKRHTSHPTHQFRRLSSEVVEKMDEARLNKFEEFTFESTGRTILMDMHVWGVNYIEVEPVII